MVLSQLKRSPWPPEYGGPQDLGGVPHPNFPAKDERIKSAAVSKSGNEVRVATIARDSGDREITWKLRCPNSACATLLCAYLDGQRDSPLVEVGLSRTLPAAFVREWEHEAARTED